MGYKNDSVLPEPSAGRDQGGLGILGPGAQPFPAQNLVTVRRPIRLDLQRDGLHGLC